MSRRTFVCDLTACAAGLAGLLPLRSSVGRRLGGDEVSYPLPAADGAMVDRDNEVIVARTGGRVYAFALSCPHQRTPLRWHEAEQRFQCPKHKSRFELDGRFIDGRATRNMDRHAVRRAGDSIVVDRARLYREDEDREQWMGAVVEVGNGR